MTKTEELAENTTRERLARELYRRIYPGNVNTHDSKRTDASDAAEFDRAYETWDAGDEGRAPGTTCRHPGESVIPGKPRDWRAAAVLGDKRRTDQVRLASAWG